MRFQKNTARARTGQRPRWGGDVSQGDRKKCNGLSRSTTCEPLPVPAASRPPWQELVLRAGWKRDVVVGGGGATQCRILCVATPCVAPPTLLPQQRLASDDSRRIPPRAPRHIRDQSSRFRTDIQRDSGVRAASWRAATTGPPTSSRAACRSPFRGGRQEMGARFADGASRPNCGRPRLRKRQQGHAGGDAIDHHVGHDGADQAAPPFPDHRQHNGNAHQQGDSRRALRVNHCK